MKKPKILVAVPNLGNIRAELSVMFLCWVSNPKYQVKIWTPQHLIPLDYARNVIRKTFLEEGHDFLLTIDSVTGDTPLLIEKDGFIDFLEIRELFWGRDLRGRSRQEVRQDINVLTRSGWEKINYLKIHKVKKPLYIVGCQGGVAKTTGDHSLFSENRATKTADLQLGQIIDQKEFMDNNSIEGITVDFARVLGFFTADGSCGHYIAGAKQDDHYQWNLSNTNKKRLEKYKTILENFYAEKFYFVSSYEGREDRKLCWKLYPVNPKNKVLDFLPWCYTKSRFKKVPKIILNSSKRIIQAFLDGYCDGDGHKLGNQYNDGENFCFDSNSFILSAGLKYLHDKLGRKLSPSLRDDKPNIISLRHTKFYKKQGVYKIIKLDDFEDYVYDIGTDDGSFVGGVGNIVYHNSDVVPPEATIELVDLSLDIVAPVCYVFKDEGIIPMALKRVSSGWQVVGDLERNQLVKVDSAGVGCLMIARRVLEKVPLFRFQYDNDGMLTIDEGFFWSDCVKAAGFDIFVFTNLVCQHFKTVDLSQMVKFQNIARQASAPPPPHTHTHT